MAAVHGEVRVLERVGSIAEALRFQDLGTVRSLRAKSLSYRFEHSRIFLPRTMAPCSTSRAARQELASRNCMKPYACLIDI